MRLTRRWVLGLFGAAAAAPVVAKVPLGEATSISTGDERVMTVVRVPARCFWTNPGTLYSDELSAILKEQSQSWLEMMRVETAEGDC